MTAKEAFKILGLTPMADLLEIKKRYRQLMHQVHPDAAVSSGQPLFPDARQLNQAYKVLREASSHGSVSAAREDTKKDSSPKETEHPSSAWNGPTNPYAFTNREILHVAEDTSGNPLGYFPIASGKYLWTMEEDFPLFLTSIFRCSKKLLDDIDACRSMVPASNSRTLFQGELAYLLAQQFLDTGSSLSVLAQEKTMDSDGSRIFRITAALEYSSAIRPLPTGASLYPSALRRHRLYLKDRYGTELGYLSFPDDRLYYVIIPLFEQRQVRLRIQVSSGNTMKQKKSSVKYQKLSLWIKIPASGICHMPENLNIRIEELLKKYRNHI